MKTKAFMIWIAMAASTAHAQSTSETDYCQRQAEYEYQLRISAPPMFPEVYPGWKGGQAGQAAAYAAAWSQRVFMECMRKMEESRRPATKQRDIRE